MVVVTVVTIVVIIVIIMIVVVTVTVTTGDCHRVVVVVVVPIVTTIVKLILRWQIKGVRSVGRAKLVSLEDDIVGQQGEVWTSKGQRKMEDSGGGLLPAVDGHSLE